MIDLMQRLARWFHPFRPVLALVACLCLGTFFYLVLSANATHDAYMLPAIVLFGWTSCLYALAGVMVQVPQRAGQTLGWLARIKRRFQRALAWLWALGFICSTLILLYLSMRTLTISMGS